ncbi:MAG: hypothetical protein ACREPA_05480 [Candidatus Dormibacteraceae bacterium]
MTWGDLAQHTVALLVYPGALAMAVFGFAAELVTLWALPGHRTGPVAALLGTPRAPSVLVVAAALLALLAASQTTFPYSPVPAAESSVLVAALAVSGAIWADWIGGADKDAPSMLGVQAAWLLALLAPAVIPQDLHPQVLGAIVVQGLLPLKVCAGLLYLVCLPPLLQIIPTRTASGRPRGHRPRIPHALLWLPLCGLFTSAYLPPPDADVPGVLGFFAVTAGAAVLSLVVAAALGRSPETIQNILYRQGIAALAVATAIAALVTSFLVRGA